MIGGGSFFHMGTPIRTGFSARIAAMSADDDERVVESLSALTRMAIAASWLTPADLLDRLADDSDLHVRMLAVQNRRLPKKAMLRLASSCSDSLILLYLAKNPSATADVLELIAIGESVNAKTALISRKRKSRVSDVMLRYLILHSNDYTIEEMSCLDLIGNTK